MEFLSMLFVLFCVHCVIDFCLQPEAMALGKSRKTNPLKGIVPWPYWLFSHSAAMGLGVYLVTGSALLGLAEIACHALVDYAKCEGEIGIHADQVCHIWCKVLWAAIAVFAMGVS